MYDHSITFETFRYKVAHVIIFKGKYTVGSVQEVYLSLIKVGKDRRKLTTNRITSYNVCYTKLLRNVRIMHVITGDHYSPAFAKDQVAMKINENAEVWLQELIKEHGYKHKVIDGTIDYKIREGNVVNEIANQAKYDDTSLIVIGSHGASGFQAKS